MKKAVHFILTIALSVIIIPNTLFGQSGSASIIGQITDTDGNMLIGATVFIEELNNGTIADVNGNYQFLGLAAGEYTVRFSYIGYQPEIRNVTLERRDVVRVNVKMQPSAMGLDEVVITGQAVGQHAAIQQQRNASGIMNVVSSEKLQELPDVNVAEAVGRLPGLMVERNRGEGQKIIIRGLQPKYNTISIGGNMMPSTSTDDRSTDLNMIAPEILGGVEVLKANTADKDADGLGGTVNLILREAPSGLEMNMGLITGYSGHSNELNNYKFNFHASNRFFNDKLGVMLSSNAEMAERNSDRFIVSYDVQGVPDYDAGENFITPWVSSAELQANIEDRTRAGGSILMDWKPNAKTTIKSNNFVGYLNRDIYDRTKNYSLTNNRISIRQYQNQISQLLYSNSLEGEHLLFGSVFNWGASRAQAINERPYAHRVDFRTLSAYNGYSQGNSFDIEPPEQIPNPENLNEFIDRYYFYDGRVSPYQSSEIEYGVFGDWKTPFKIGDYISGHVKAGGKLRYKDRNRTNELFVRRLDPPGSVNSFLEQYPDYALTTEGVVGRISILNFLDQNYEPGTFLDDQFEYLTVNEVLDIDKISQVYDDFLKDYYNFIPAGAQNDYETRESILAYYAMSEIKIGKYITFIPGVRVEATDIEYEAYIADAIPDDLGLPSEVDFRDTLATNYYRNILPQIHLRITPTDWFDVRMAYTNTLSRPDYNQLAPKKIINPTGRTVELGNTNLNPAKSENFDLIFTLFKPNFGLFTIGGFYKEIDGFLWNRQAIVVAGTETAPEVLSLPESSRGFEVRYPLNNANLSTIKGLEIDVQSNMNFLPVKGFVFNFNLTFMESETKYNEALIVRTLNPDFGVIPGAPRVLLVNQDTAYVDRLLQQPSYLLNAGIGYDNRDWGLSVRLSFNYQDDILIREQRRPDGADREGTVEFYRWDFQLNQKITKRLSLNANVANIFNQPDKSVRLITGYIRDLEYYGLMAQVGLRYNLF
jgi:TonB-dependent receptor